MTIKFKTPNHPEYIEAKQKKEFNLPEERKKLNLPEAVMSLIRKQDEEVVRRLRDLDCIKVEGILREIILKEIDKIFGEN